MNESDSDNESVASDSSRASGRSNGSRRSGAGERKRKHEDVATDDDDDSDAESTLAKKQRVANSRTTGLKTVKTPNSLLSESSLPTPGVTGDEDGDEVCIFLSPSTPFQRLKSHGTLADFRLSRRIWFQLVRVAVMMSSMLIWKRSSRQPWKEMRRRLRRRRLRLRRMVLDDTPECRSTV
jgi:hypothetical protein